MNNGNEIAVIGMSGRFPGAGNIGTFWDNLRNGVESVRFFSDEEMLAAGVDPALLQRPDYVKAKAVLDDAEYFDALFFGYSPREAEIMDPQHRIFLEEAFHALEDAGYDTSRYKGSIGLFGGADVNTYLINNLLPNSHLLAAAGGLQVLIANEKNHMLTRTAYKLDLRGPCINIQTACSTSLAAIHFACQSLLSGECDMALAGAVSVSAPLKNGYLYEKGMISSPDGHCRVFDGKAQGSVSGNGIGIVVLKPLEEAMEDGDHIYAVIRGSAINNDGAGKASYTAPGADGQARVIAETLAITGIDPETLGYVEANGTGSELGDPIEIEALTRAFMKYTDKKNFCAIGSVKSNIGHLNEAAGMAAFIKTLLMMGHKQIAGTLHYERPNPRMDLPNSPFHVAGKLLEWTHDKTTPRRAGINAFGIGGTNVHMIVEEAPTQHFSVSPRVALLLPLSARTRGALDVMTEEMIDYLEANPDGRLKDIAYTLQVGRREQSYRRMVVAGNIPSAIDALRKARQQPSIAVGERNAVSILYASKGGPAPDPMGWQVVYRGEQGFRSAFDECALLIRAMLSIDLLEAFDPAGNKEAIASMPALSFCWEYALLCLLRSWGIRPGKFVCEGTAGFVAAVLSGTMKMEDAIRQGLTGEPGEQAVPRSGEQVAGKETGDGNNILLLHDEGDMDLLRHATDKMPVVCLLRDRRDDGVAAMRVVGELWRLGVRVDWDKVNSSRRYCRLSLPAYPFERQPYWIQGRNNPLSTGQANDQSLPGSKYGSRQERSPDDPYIAPVTETEEALAAIWQAAFGLEAISVHDNFFDMGGHSLMGIQILARVRDQFGLNLPPGTLYERPTLASFAALIDNKLWLMKAPEPAYEESGLSYTEEGII